MTAAPGIGTASLERRRRLSLRAAVAALAIAVVALPLGMSAGGSDARETAGGALILGAIAGAIACPWIVRAWQTFMRRTMIDAAVGGHTDITHIDAGRRPAESRAALSSDAFGLGAFRDSGLVEAFESAAPSHVLTGLAQGVPFAVAELGLLNAKGYRVFNGVLASFRLARPRPGLTIVARDHSLLGNVLAGAGSALERLPLEDPAFEGIFEVYGTDQVEGRVILTTTMLERLKALDEVSAAHGFACAFLESHLLVAFRGMTWRCPPWRIVEPVDKWLEAYVARLARVVDLPVDVVRTLNLEAPSDRVAPRPIEAPFETAHPTSVVLDSSSGQVFVSGVWRLIGEGGMPLLNIASGLIFGGVALMGAWYGVTQGYSPHLFWYFWPLIACGIAYGIFAIAGGVRDVGKLAWGWNAPLRGVKRPYERQQ